MAILFVIIKDDFYDIIWIYHTIPPPFFPTATPPIRFLFTPKLDKWNSLLISSNPVSLSSKSSHIQGTN